MITFIRGLDRDRSLSTNIQYRGIVYSDKLMKAESFSGIQVALENLNKAYLYGSEFKRQYEGALLYPRAITPMKNSARESFGNDIIIYIDLSRPFFMKERVEFVEKNTGIFIPDEKAHRGNFDGCLTLGQLNNVSIGGKPESIEKESKPKAKEEDKYRIKEGNATVTVYHLC